MEENRKKNAGLVKKPGFFLFFLAISGKSITNVTFDFFCTEMESENSRHNSINRFREKTPAGRKNRKNTLFNDSIFPETL